MDRIFEIDFARGSAIFMMIASNLITDLQYFYNYAAYQTFWQVFATIGASIFLLIVGISMNLSYAKDKNIWRFAKRGTFIFALGLLITFVTWIFVPLDYIRFGVLHLIGLSIIIGYPFLKLDKKFALFAGLGFVLAGFVIGTFIASTNALLFLGVTTSSFSSLDYFPIFPWFGLVLMGLFLGKWLYPDGKSKFKLPEIKLSKPVSWLGRHSLVIYLIHQPIIIGLLFLFVS